MAACSIPHQMMHFNGETRRKKTHRKKTHPSSHLMSQSVLMSLSVLQTLRLILQPVLQSFHLVRQPFLQPVLILLLLLLLQKMTEKIKDSPHILCIFFVNLTKKFNFMIHSRRDHRAPSTYHLHCIDYLPRCFEMRCF